MPLENDELYSDFLVELYKNPKNFGKPIKYNKSANSMNASCGDEFTIYIEINKNGKIKNASFEGKGCVISTASASLLGDFIIGKTEDNVKNMKKEDALKLLKIDLSKNPSRIKCALLPFYIMQEALNKK